MVPMSESWQLGIQCIVNAVIDANAVVGGSQQRKGEFVEIDLLLKDTCTEGEEEEKKRGKERRKKCQREPSLGDYIAFDQWSSSLWTLRQAPSLTPVIQLILKQLLARLV